MKLNDEQLTFVDALYHDMGGRLRIYANSALDDTYLAEEAVQEAFRVACAKPQDLMRSENPYGWMLKALKNVIRNMKRTMDNRSRFVARVLALAEEAGQEDDHVEAEYADLIEQEEFELLKQIVLKQYSIFEVATELGISLEACKKRVQRAKAKMREKIEEFEK